MEFLRALALPFRLADQAAHGEREPPGRHRHGRPRRGTTPLAALRRALAEPPPA
jgi:hypothetical protein